MAAELTKGVEPTPAPDGGVYFSAYFDTGPQLFHITREALEDHFCEPTGHLDDAVAAFKRGVSLILACAEQKLGRGTTGRIMLMTHDF